MSVAGDLLLCTEEGASLEPPTWRMTAGLPNLLLRESIRLVSIESSVDGFGSRPIATLQQQR